MAKKIDAWRARGWIRGEKLDGGNQGHTFLARKEDDDPATFKYVLKELKRNDDETRRARFHIEAASLRALNLPGVARLADSNAEQFLNPDVNLYVVTERIDGTDLTQYRGNPIGVTTALRILTQVLRTIQQCHDVPVVHRDIKPEHVILRAGNLDDPVLIDFGLASNQELALPNTPTAIEQGVGNRFIIMPEQLHGTNKRDPRSDITQCVGLLHFLLSGKVPGIIFDSQRRKPHEREPVVEDSSLSGVQKRILRNIFDVGFDWDIERRWPSAESLMRQFESLLSGKEDVLDRDFISELDQLAKRVNEDPEHTRQIRTKELCRAMVKKGEQCAHRIREKFGDTLSVTNGSHSEEAGVSYSLDWYIQRTMGDKQPYALSLDARRETDILYLRAHLSKKSIGGFLIGTFGSGGTGKSAEVRPIPNLFDQEGNVVVLQPDAEDKIGEFLRKLWTQAIEKVLYPTSR